MTKAQQTLASEYLTRRAQQTIAANREKQEQQQQRPQPKSQSPDRSPEIER